MGVLLVLLGTIAFAVNVIIAPFIYQSGSDPLTMIAFRSAVFVSILGPVMLALKQPLWLPVRDRLFSVGLGVLFTIQGLCFFTAISRIPVSIGTLIEYTYPFQVAIVSRFLFGELLTIARLSLIIVALFGLGLVLETPAEAGGLDNFGVGLMVVASMLLTTKILLTHRLLTRVDSRRVALYMSATVAAVCMSAFVLTPLTPAWPETTEGWCFLWLAPASNLFGVLCFYTGLSMIGPGRAAMLSNSEPLVILILAVMILGETLTVVQSLGAALVLFAIVAFQMVRVRHKGNS